MRFAARVRSSFSSRVSSVVMFGAPCVVVLLGWFLNFCP
jgi:hypothetical protein